MRRKRKLSKKEIKAAKKVSEAFKVSKVSEVSEVSEDEKLANAKTQKEREAQKKTIELPQVITVRDFAEALELPVTQVIQELMKNGVMASINESIDFDTAVIVGDELGYEVKAVDRGPSTVDRLTTEERKKLKPRPPVIVVLGHVDHGKTKLLDAIRKADVVSEESGGITQHIGAYQTTWKTKEGKNYPLTFLDTPGHEAFSAMRAHGANITDLAILVVAADDGVKPQTKEAISHAKAANVPIIVAINKIDKPEANVERTKRQLADLGLNPEEWGGKTIMVPISAKQGKNIDKLLDMVILNAELEELKAPTECPASGAVIESHMQAGVGPVATVLIQKGCLKVGDALVVGQTLGKIRLMEDFRGQRISEAGPSMPAKIAGLRDMPNFGDLFQVVADEKTARNLVAVKTIKIHKFGLAEVSEKAKKGKLTILNIILKTDTQGSLTALRTSLESIGDENIKIKVLHEGVGDINESDINMAVASRSLVLGFKVKVAPEVKKFAEEKGIKISLYDIIYNLIDDVSAALQGLVKPEIVETLVGKLEVLKVFHSAPKRKVVGGKVVDGKFETGLKVHLYHSGERHGKGKIETLQKEKNQVSEVERGFECGVAIETETRIKPGDLIEAYSEEEQLKKIK